MSYNLEVPGAWQEFSTPENSFCSMSSNKPLLVMQFGLGTTDGVGDPFMMMITPVEQYSNMLRRFPELLLVQRAAWRIRLLSCRGACKSRLTL